ncbi:MAG: PAS domain S-box protein [bacterium]
MIDIQILLFDTDRASFHLIQKGFKEHGFNLNLHFQSITSSSSFSIEEFEKVDMIIYVLADPTDSLAEKVLKKALDKIPVMFLVERHTVFLGADLVKKGAIDYLFKTDDVLAHLPARVFYLLRDWDRIVALQRAETKLLESENKYRRVTENINDVVWEMDLRMKHFSFVSEAVTLFLGYSPEEFLLLPPASVIHPSSLQLLEEERKKIILRLKQGEKADDIHLVIEVMFIHKNGDTRWGEIRGFLVQNENHQFVAVSGIARDITLQKQAQQDLEVQEAFFETLIREAPLPIVILDNKDRIKQINNHFTQLFGYTPEEALGYPVNDLIVPENLKKEGDELSIMASNGEVINTETIRCTKEGKEVDVEIIGKPVMLHDSKIGVFGIYQDISQRKKVEVATRVAEIKQQFLANMSHEIRTPMTGILGMIELLKNTTLNAQQLFFVDIIKRSSDSLMHIVNDILDLSKIEAGKLIIRYDNYNLRKSAEVLYSLFKALASQKGIDFYLEVDPQLPTYVYADENRINQIITNLLSNAVKFTSHGMVQLRYELLEKISSGYLIRISVKDTGIGISDEEKEKLFQIFSQIDSSDTRCFDGTGLGLSISKRLAELMDAKIEVSSKKNKGSIFSLTLKVKECENESYAEPLPGEEDEYNLPGQGVNVLLTEDKRTNQMVISMMLGEAGCEVEVASNGQEALDAIAPGKFDFVLMDIQMPVMDGVTAVKELRKKYTPEELPVIIGLSAKAMEGDAEYFIEQGMDDYLTKPVTTETLRKCIARWMRKKEIHKTSTS